jgi:hypothetical protein
MNALINSAAEITALCLLPALVVMCLRPRGVIRVWVKAGRRSRLPVVLGAVVVIIALAATKT